MLASRGMGAINPSKMPKAKKKARRDDTDFTQYAEGGKVRFMGKEVPVQDIGISGDTGRFMGKEVPLDPYVRDKLKQALGMKKGGKVNAAGNYTKPSLRKKIVSQVKAAATHGTGAGQWSARKAQLVAKKYKAAGGGYKD